MSTVEWVEKLFNVLFVSTPSIFLSGRFVLLLLLKVELSTVANAEITDNPIHPVTIATENMINKLKFEDTLSIIKNFTRAIKTYVVFYILKQ